MSEPSQDSRTPYAYEEPRPSFLSNVLAIIGFIILIVIVIWGLMHLAGISRAWFSSLFGGASANIEVSAPETARSGSPFGVAWEYDEPAEGTYALLYPCQAGLQFQTPSPLGGMNGIPCGAAFTLAGQAFAGSNEVSLTPFLSSAEALSVPLTIIFMPIGTGTEAQGSATVEIAPFASATPAPVPSPAPTTPEPSSAPAPSPSPAPAAARPADLSVRITSVSVDAYGNGVAVFDIANIGGTASGSYYFTASLPARSNSSSYTSPTQSSLAPGAHIQNTLRFSPAISGVFSVSIVKSDANPANNYASRSVNAPHQGSYLPTQTSHYPYQAQYATGYYPYSGYTGHTGSYQTPQYQRYPRTPAHLDTRYQFVPGQGYTNVYVPRGYTQQYPYSTHYPYAY